MGLVREMKKNKLVEHEDDGDTNSSSCTWNGAQSIGKKTGGIRNQRKNRNHTDHCIVKIDLHTEKSPENLRDFLSFRLK